MASLLLALIYVCFISLGLPDSLLGSAWPVLHRENSVPVSFAGIVSATICAGTILSSLFSDKLLRKFGAGKMTAVSIALTAMGLFGFSGSDRFWMLMLWAIPYGLGAGGVDAVLNNYVALHYKPQHMSWLHCMWGVGASISPYIMSFSLMRFDSWNNGYLFVAVIQAVLSAGIFLSIPLWKKGMQAEEDGGEETVPAALSFREIFAIKGAIPCFVTFFCYCSLELTTSLWASSYLVTKWSFSPEAAASFASMFYIGITLGRFANGFLAMKLGDHFLIRMGIGVICAGIVLLALPLHSALALVGFAVIGLGCAPIYPCIIHSTPARFGEKNSQALIGVQMAAAYTGTCLMPSLFGIFANKISLVVFPIFISILTVTMIVMFEVYNKKATIK